MARATLSYVSLSSIEPNPFRGRIGFDPRKLDALMRSIEEVGMWEGMVGRGHGNGYQLAFGHHRLEAARKKKLTTVPLIIRELNDRQMIELMGRENLEDYNADFLILLGSWEAARKYFTAVEGKEPQAIDVAGLLGWTRPHAGAGKTPMLNNYASACNAAQSLIAGGHFSRDDLADLTVSAAREILERTQSRMQMLEKMGSMGKRPTAEVTRDKKHVGSAARSVAKDFREGKIGRVNIRREVDFRTVKTATAKGKASPLLAAFAKDVAEQIHKMLVSDTTSTRLSEVEKVLPLVELQEDRAALRRIDFALAEHVETTATWRNRLTPRGQRVVPFKLLKKESA